MGSLNINKLYRIIFFCLTLLCEGSALFAQSNREQQIRNKYEGYIRTEEQYISRCISEINSAINLRNSGYISGEQYQETRRTWEEEKRKAEKKIESYKREMVSEISKSRQEEQKRKQKEQQQKAAQTRQTKRARQIQTRNDEIAKENAEIERRNAEIRRQNEEIRREREERERIEKAAREEAARREAAMEEAPRRARNQEILNYMRYEGHDRMMEYDFGGRINDNAKPVIVHSDSSSSGSFFTPTAKPYKATSKLSRRGDNSPFSREPSLGQPKSEIPTAKMVTRTNSATGEFADYIVRNNPPAPYVSTFYPFRDEEPEESWLSQVGEKISSQVDVWNEKMGSTVLLSSYDYLTGLARKTISSGSAVGNAIMKVYDSAMELMAVKDLFKNIAVNQTEAVKKSVITGNARYVELSGGEAKKNLDNETDEMLYNKGLLLPNAKATQKKAKSVGKDVTKEAGKVVFLKASDKWTRDYSNRD